jgi:hypothetical protein
MPTLAVYFDTSNSSFLLKKDKRNINIYPFPYVYSKSLFANQYLEKDLCKSIIEMVIADKKVKSSTYDMVVSFFSNLPELFKKPKFKVGIQDLVRDCEEYFPVVISGESYVTPNSFLISTSRNDSTDNNSNELNDSIENLYIYPHVISDDISIQGELDKKIVHAMSSGLKTDGKNKILFSGGRFFQRNFNKELDYVMILSLIKKLGVYDIFIDRSNAFPLVQSMKMYDKSLDISLSDHIEGTGTFVCSGGSVECLLKTSVGEDRFFEIEKDRVAVVPLMLDSPAKIHIKSPSLGSLDINTKGGEIGLVFDTRVSRGSVYSSVKLFNECIREFSKSFSREKNDRTNH